jgi:hypothetical protein
MLGITALSCTVQSAVCSISLDFASSVTLEPGGGIAPGMNSGIGCIGPGRNSSIAPGMNSGIAPRVVVAKAPSTDP